MSHHLGEFGEEAVVASGDDERPRLRLETLEGHHAVAARAVPLRNLTGGAEACEVSLEPSEAGLEERGVDHTAAARVLALDQSGEGAHGRPHPRALIEHGGADSRAH